MITNDHLQHFGVKGMKWGVRRSKRKVGRESWSDDAKTASDLRKKNVKQLSNAELKKLNERLNLERQYKDLNRHKRSAGEKFVSEVVFGAMKDTAKSYVTKYMKSGVEWAIQKGNSK